jgi:hypothetical protein
VYETDSWILSGIRHFHRRDSGDDVAGGGLAGLMMLQVRSEEKQLEADFGEEYLAYKQRTGRFFTFR